MSHVWLVVALVAAATALLKATGPVFLGRRELPAPVASVVTLLAPALLAALVVTQTLGGGAGIAVDERVYGLGAAALAIALRAPIIAVVALAAAVTAAARLLSGT